MSAEDGLRLGETVPMGAFTFDAASIKRFAAAYDPRPFHLDEVAAERSIFGGLCASGWHTAAVWMKCNIAAGGGPASAWIGSGQAPVFGPSPGFRNLRWPKPVHTGETVSYSRTAVALDSRRNATGWHRLALRGRGIDSQGDEVLSFDSEVLIRFG